MWLGLIDSEITPPKKKNPFVLKTGEHEEQYALLYSPKNPQQVW